MKPKIDERIKEEYEAKIEGKFKIYLGNELYAKGKNKWTRYFASSLLQFVVCGVINALPGPYGETAGMSTSYTARAGNDTSTPSSPDMADLVSKIDIAPDTQNRVIFKSSGYTEYRSRHKFVWNSGTIPAQTIGEFGVYLIASSDSWTSPVDNPAFYSGVYCSLVQETAYMPLQDVGLRLCARISSADEDFDPIDYDSSEALILEWWVTIRF